MTDSIRQLIPADVGEYPDALRDAERREARPARAWRVGLALSGGGIRSATFSLGFVQGLVRRGVLGSVDYLSTVSGGGYLGGFLGRLFCRDDIAQLPGAGAATAGDDHTAAVQSILTNSRTGPVRFLRENGRYLTPNGLPDLVKGAAVAVRNWAAVHVVMIVSGLFALSLLELATHLTLQALSPGVMRYLLLPFAVGVSPALVGVGAVVGVMVIALGWGYWLVPESAPGGDLLRGWPRPVVVLLVGIALAYLTSAGFIGRVGWAIVAIVLVTLAMYAFAWLRLAWHHTGTRSLAGYVQMLRTQYTAWLAEAAIILLVIVALALVDVMGRWLVQRGTVRFTLPGIYAAAAAVVGALRPALERLAHKDGSPVKLPVGVLAAVLATALLLAVLGALAAVPKVIVHDFDYTHLAWAAAALGLLTLSMGWMRVFVNRSSLYATYEERLRRAYLGASNAARLADDGPTPLADSHPDDGVAFGAYHPERHGGPVHLVNVTVNETVDGRSQVEQRDRKGLALAVGPGGASVGVSHHALWAGSDGVGLWQRAVGEMRSLLRAPASGGFRVFPAPAFPELLDLGQWVAVSGAAFSTGLGARTSFGLSVLAGLANIRLGYWWNSGINPRTRGGRARPGVSQRLRRAGRWLFPVQSALLNEWLARFPGVAQRFWYLSDGGHFENTAAYELIRRRLPFIVICDDGADPGYLFEDVGNLVRKARVDFGAEIAFADRERLDVIGVDRSFRGIGTLDDLRPRPAGDAEGPGLSRAHAALAEVTYAPRGGASQRGLLLLVKPTVTIDVPADVRQYHAEHGDFPQQTTLDQFFDEAQWESYRCLGEHVASQLFGDTSGRWSPRTEIRRSPTA